MENYPLLPSSTHADAAATRKYEAEDKISTHIKIEEYVEEEDDDEDDKLLFADGKKRGTSLILNDTCLLILHFLQTWAILQSLALRWPWPSSWLENTNFIFLFNLDIWEFSKFLNNNTYQNMQGYYTPTELLPVGYWHILLAWAVFVFLAITALIISYTIITYKRHPFMMVQIATMQRVYIIGMQIIYLPLGITLARLFHCTDTGKLDVDNTVTCWEGEHWGYVAPALAVSIGMYVLFPAWLITRTRREMLNMTTDRHEGYLQLKETEYVQGLDILYVVGNFHVFSSFKKHGAHYRAILLLMGYAVLIFYAGLFNHIFAQAVTINVLLFLVWLVFIIIRPYRVSAFNVMLLISYLCLNCACLIGALRSNFTSFTIQTIWLTPDYVIWILIVIMMTWLLATAIFLIYLTIRYFVCCKRWFPYHLWPTMDSRGLQKLSPQTRKYVRTVIKGRTLVEKVLQMPPMFAPAHELSRYIHIVNAYCREAEHIRDPIHDTLWDLLDELIEAHDQIAPKSLFADSVKESIRHTATEFMKMMPTFVRRVAQREYDFILLSPLKRRMLLKMYCIGLFLNGRRQNQERQKVTLPRLQKVWPHNKQFSDYEDGGYYEDMYPDEEERPEFRPVTAVSIDLMSDRAIDDDLALEEAEEFTKNHPLSRQMYANIAFEDDKDDISTILRDDLSDVMSLNVPDSTKTNVSSTVGLQSNSKVQSERTELSLSAYSDDREQREGAMWAESPLPGQIKNSSIVRPGSAASITGPTPGVSPIQKSQQDKPSPLIESQGGFSSTPHPGQNGEHILTPTPGSTASSGRQETMTPERQNSSKERDESIMISINATGQSEV